MPYRDPAKRRAYFRQRYATDPVFRAKALARQARRVVDPAVRAEQTRRSRQKPSVRLRYIAYQKLFKQQHPRYFNEAASRYRALKMDTTVEKIDYAQVLADAQGICQICHTPLVAPIEYDHVIPLSRGGTHTKDNLQATHASCNRHKSAKVA